MRTLKKTAALALVSIITAAGLVATAAPASADAAACTPAPWGEVCVRVYGTGLEVDKARVGRDSADYAGICNYYAMYKVYSPSGSVLDKRFSATRGSCTWGYAYMDFPSVNSVYPDGSRACGAFYQAGVRQGGEACIRIERS